MKIKFVAEIVADVHIFPDDVLNSDTIGEYASEINANIDNAALAYLIDKKVKGDLTILASCPIDEGVAEYNAILNNWQDEYNERIKQFIN